MTLRVGVWCAVSSKPQAEKASLSDQEQAGRQFADALNAQVVAVYVVPGHTREYVFWHEAEEVMGAYAEVRRDLEAGRLDVVHAIDADRLGRDAALIAQFQSLANRHGCEVYLASAPHPVGQQSVGHRYLTAIMGVRAEEDASLRKIRRESGMKGRVKKGLPPGELPYGYRMLRDEHGRAIGGEFDPETVGAVRLITELYLQGKSYRSIMVALDASPWRPRRVSHWTTTAVRKLLLCDTYAGIVTYNEVVTQSTRYPPLWDAEIYAAILQERGRRRKPRSYNHPRSGPLRGVVWCGDCGAPMYRMERRGVRYLRCGAYGKIIAGPRPCRPNTVREQDAVDAVIGFFESLVTPEQIAAMLDESTDDAGRWQQEHEELTGKLQTLGEQRRRLALAFAAGKMDVDVYQVADADLSSQQAAAQKRMTELDALLADSLSSERRADRLSALSVTIRELIENNDPATVATALQNVGLRAELTNHDGHPHIRVMLV